MMTKEVTDEEFKRLLKNNSTANALYQKLIKESDDDGIERREGTKQARAIVLESLQPKDDDEKDDSKWYENHDFGASDGLRGDMTWTNDNERGEIDWDSCPSKGARNLLMGIRRDLGGDKARLMKFLDNLPKFLPSGAERAEAERRTDDGRKLPKLNDKIIRAKQKAMNEACKMVEKTDWNDE